METTAFARIEFKEEEFWDGDAHLAHVIGSMALTIRDIHNTIPQELTTREWDDILTRIGEPLLAYAEEPDREGGDRSKAARAALELFSQWFDKFWD